MTVRPGRLISLEGGEGVGKSTQARRLAEALRARGLEVEETREPGGSPGAEGIRGLLMQGGAGQWTPQTEALLFAAARADHVARLIRPALARGAWVVSDRFVDSSLAYQGGADGLGQEAIRALHQIGSGGLLPDRTLLLAMPLHEASYREWVRDAGELDRFGARGEAYHARVGEAFAMLKADPANRPERYRTISALGDVAVVTDRLLDAVADLL